MHQRVASLTSPTSIMTRRTFYGSREPTPVENDFDKNWRKLNRQEREKVAAEYAPLGKMDWKQLSMDQKKARKCIKLTYSPISILFNNFFSLYDRIWFAWIKRS